MYKLLDFDDNEISFDQLDDKAFWCKHGELQEKAFINIFQKLQNKNILKTIFDISIHPEKNINPYHPDLLVNKKYIGDAKIKNSPLFMAKTYSVSPQFALTIDLKDIFNYRKRLISKSQDVYVFIWVKWEAHKMITSHKTYSVEKMGGIWVSKISQLLEHLKKNKVGIHWYKEKFRHPAWIQKNTPWAEELIQFEPRLYKNGKVKNISSNGFLSVGKENISYPSGHSSCSYVFDLSNKDIFDEIYLKLT